MLFREGVTVYCENHMGHINTLCGQKIQSRALQETHYVSATKPNRLMLYRETAAVYCEKHTEHTHSVGRKLSPCLIGNTLRLRYKAQPVNAV
jgi:hypothetical protein